MLDNVIDINFYTIPEARRSNLRHRPVGLGLMGFQDALFALRHPVRLRGGRRASPTLSMEQISYHAIAASSDLAAERGRYPTLRRLAVEPRHPADRLDRPARRRARRAAVDVDRSHDSTGTRCAARVRSDGMRNSNVMAIAPTATISNICGVSQSIEPTFRNLYVKSNMSGEFTVVNPYLVADLKERGLWDEVMVADLKYYDGSPRGDRARSRPTCGSCTRPRSRSTPHWLIAGGVAPAEVDRPGAVAEPLRRRAERPGARRAVPAGLAQRPEDHLLPALPGRHARREVTPCKGPDGRLNAVPPSICRTPPARVDDPDCEACQ